MAMDFGSAIAMLKGGRLVAREGWNGEYSYGKGMYLFLDTAPGGSTGMHYQPVIVMFTAQLQFQPGWLASQADMLAEDWCEVPST